MGPFFLLFAAFGLLKKREINLQMYFLIINFPSHLIIPSKGSFKTLNPLPPPLNTTPGIVFGGREAQMDSSSLKDPFNFAIRSLKLKI